MYKNNKILVTVCARGGSRGVKNKNIRLLNNKPLICHTLDILKKSPFIDAYVISSDSGQIIKVAQDYGCEVYFKRPKRLAQDKVGRIEAIRHAANWIENDRKEKYEIIADLGVATPLKTTKDFEGCVKLLIDKGASNVFSVSVAQRNPYYNMIEIKRNRVKIVKKISGEISDRRDAPLVYSLNDGVNVWRRRVLFSKQPFFTSTTKAYIMPRERSIDIDEEVDFKIAECLCSTPRL
jgi:CMP-N,N'-diacetyllegionaminic acid synthase